MPTPKSKKAVRNTCIATMQDEDGKPIEIARSGTRVYTELGLKTKPNDLIRKLI